MLAGLDLGRTSECPAQLAFSLGRRNGVRCYAFRRQHVKCKQVVSQKVPNSQNWPEKLLTWPLVPVNYSRLTMQIFRWDISFE
jgi:hypothetical protein